MNHDDKCVCASCLAARHNAGLYAQGRADERAAIVAWLFRGKSSTVHASPDNAPGEKYTYGREIIRFYEDDDGAAEISDADLSLVLASPSLLNACVVAERFLAPCEADVPDTLTRVLTVLRSAIADAKAFP